MKWVNSRIALIFLTELREGNIAIYVISATKTHLGYYFCKYITYMLHFWDYNMCELSCKTVLYSVSVRIYCITEVCGVE